jgi:hypothetical protein
MSFDACIDTAVSGGELSPADAARLKRDYAAFRRRFAQGSEVTADAEAKKALAELLKAESAHARRKAKLALKSIKRIENDLKNHRNAKGESDLAGGHRFLRLVYDNQTLYEAIAGRSSSRWAKFDDANTDYVKEVDGDGDRVWAQRRNLKNKLENARNSDR